MEREASRVAHEQAISEKAAQMEHEKAAGWAEFSREYPDEVLPLGWKPAEVVSLRGLSARSSGCGSHRRGGNNVHIWDPNRGSRGGFLCEYEPKYDIRVQGIAGYYQAPDFDAPNCKACQKRAGALKKAACVRTAN